MKLYKYFLSLENSTSSIMFLQKQYMWLQGFGEYILTQNRIGFLKVNNAYLREKILSACVE